MAPCSSAGVRKCGYSCPWHPLQFVAWAFIVLFTLFHYGFAVFYVPGYYWRVAAFIVPGLVLITHAVCTVVTSAIDPSEAGVRDKHALHTARTPFNRSVHKHVIEDEYCHICEVMVNENAKHCRLCDKCVKDFDHHCFWLNNCIGSRNYRWFFATVLSALFGAILLFCFNLALFVLFFADRESLRYGCDRPTNVSSCDATLRVFSVAVPDPVFPTITAVMFLLAAIAIGLVGHLTGFHIYLMCRDISTYDWIMEDRNGRKKQALTNAADKTPKKCNCLRKKGNRISPSDEEMSVGSAGEYGYGGFDEDADARSVVSCTSVAVDKPLKSILASGKRMNERRNHEIEVEVSVASSLHLDYSTTIASVASAADVAINMEEGPAVVVVKQKSAPQFPFHLRPSPSVLDAAPKKNTSNEKEKEEDDGSILNGMIVANSIRAGKSAPELKFRAAVKREEEEEEDCSLLSLMATANSVPTFKDLPEAIGIADQVGKPSSDVIRRASLESGMATKSRRQLPVHLRLPPLAVPLQRWKSATTN